MDTVFVQKVKTDLEKYGITFTPNADKVLDMFRLLTSELMLSSSAEADEIAYIYYALTLSDLTRFYSCGEEEVGHYMNCTSAEGIEYTQGVRIVLDSVYKNKGYLGETIEEEDFNALVLSTLLLDKVYGHYNIERYMSDPVTVIMTFILTAANAYEQVANSNED